MIIFKPFCISFEIHSFKYFIFIIGICILADRVLVNWQSTLYNIKKKEKILYLIVNDVTFDEIQSWEGRTILFLHFEESH